MALSIDRLPTLGFPANGVIEGTLAKFLATTALEHGPIFVLRTETEGDFVFMVGPEANRFVMHTHRDRFSHKLGWTPVIGDWSGQGLLNMDPPEHTIHRRLMNPAFTSSYLAVYLPLMNQVIQDRTADWLARGEVDLQEEAREIAFDIASVALVGLRTGEEVDLLRKLFYILLHGFSREEQTWEQWIAMIQRTVAELDAMLLNVIAARRRLPEAAQPKDVLARIIHARDERNEELSPEQILAHVKIFLVAGHETTTSLAARVLYLLASRTDYRQRITEEIESLGTPPSEAHSFEGLRALKYLDTFIREVGRLYSPVLNVPRGVLQDFEFGGYNVPAGTAVRLSIAGCHHLPTVFADPESFDPDRFLSPRDEDARTPYGLVTFGAGPRTCIGMSFAQVEVKSLVAHVLRQVRLEAASDPDLVHAGFWTAFVPGGVPVKVRPRS